MDRIKVVDPCSSIYSSTGNCWEERMSRTRGRLVEEVRQSTRYCLAFVRRVVIFCTIMFMFCYAMVE